MTRRSTPDLILTLKPLGLTYEGDLSLPHRGPELAKILSALLHSGSKFTPEEQKEIDFAKGLLKLLPAYITTERAESRERSKSRHQRERANV